MAKLATLPFAVCRVPSGGTVTGPSNTSALSDEAPRVDAGVACCVGFVVPVAAGRCCWAGAAARWASGCGGTGGGSSPVHAPVSSMSCVNRSVMLSVCRTAPTNARLALICVIVLMSPRGLSTNALPTAWPMMAWSLSGKLALQPPFLPQQTQPPSS